MTKRIHQKAGRPHAFTLVELLVVIGIIAILMAILLPALGRAKSQASTVACLANLRSIGQAVQIYTNQNKGSLPYGYWDGVGSPDGRFDGSSGISSDWQLLLMSSAFAKGGATYATQNGAENSKLQEAFACPVASPDSGNAAGSIPRKVHYACHPRLMPNLDDTDKSKRPPYPLLAPYKLAKIRRGSELILIFDGSQVFFDNFGNSLAVADKIDSDALHNGTATASGHLRNYLLTKPGVDLGASIDVVNKDFASINAARQDIRFRHGKNDAANFLFADCHAETRNFKNGSSDIKLRNIYLDQ